MNGHFCLLFYLEGAGLLFISSFSCCWTFSPSSSKFFSNISYACRRICSLYLWPFILSKKEESRHGSFLCIFVFLLSLLPLRLLGFLGYGLLGLLGLLHLLRFWLYCLLYWLFDLLCCWLLLCWSFLCCLLRCCLFSYLLCNFLYWGFFSLCRWFLGSTFLCYLLRRGFGNLLGGGLRHYCVLYLALS